MMKPIRLIGVMPEEHKPSSVVPHMRPATFGSLVHRLAKDTGNIKFSNHARERMEERGIRDFVVVDVLRFGEIKGEVKPGNNPGDWKAKFVREAKGRREVGVVVVTYRNSSLLVKTAEWEDAK
jgi:hypothetical protein